MSSKNFQDSHDVDLLNELRHSIDNIDAALIYMLSERFKCTRQIGFIKAQTNLPATDNKRESNQKQRLRALAKDSSLNPDFAEQIFDLIVSEVVKNHKDISRQLNNKQQK
ncbi:chorismate mutase [Aristophania vespae]|uniref:chorismate mutase n=1 Tax=Aristophania vespae TaxID=2697033 RepID=A0A6P1NB72_9PROT|nr:chorismate mutase [Aristophania vespae]QHI95626.1 chorismate mutase [Aristophania vespae]UMM63298.1 hypothetical protein DM15PD_02560 [Aristophania vespae]